MESGGDGVHSILFVFDRGDRDLTICGAFTPEAKGRTVAALRGNALGPRIHHETLLIRDTGVAVIDTESYEDGFGRLCAWIPWSEVDMAEFRGEFAKVVSQPLTALWSLDDPDSEEETATAAAFHATQPKPAHDRSRPNSASRPLWISPRASPCQRRPNRETCLADWPPR